MTKFKRLTALLLALMFCMLLVFAACTEPNCEKDGHKWGDDGKCTVCGEPKPVETEYVYRDDVHPETRPLTMSIQNPDGVFNPFFSTSAMDSNIIGMTQIGMLSSSADGKPKCGEDEPVAVKAYQIKQTDDGLYTDYTFIIKNGIKFSDGTPLTIKDILFNLYVYLDPVYTGSATIYSTDIVGLQAYRLQDPYANEDDAAAFEDSFYLAAAESLTELISFVRAYGIYVPSDLQPAKPAQDKTNAEIMSYWELVAFTAKEFRKELESDWNNASVEANKDEGFTEKWQVFLAQDAGEDFYLRNPDNTYWKDPETKSRKVNPELIAAKEAELDEYLADLKLEKTEENIKNWAINGVYEVYFPMAIDWEKGTYNDEIFDIPEIKEDEVDKINAYVNTIKSYMAQIQAQQFSAVASAWATSQVLFDQLFAEAKSKAFDNSDHPVKTVSGITSSAAELDKVSVDFDGNNLGEPHDVLNIRINGIDPKAIWNFAFTIAPLHYYSGTFEGVDYVKTFNAAEGNFGFKYGSTKFFTQVLNAGNKVGLPLGAGVYMASTSSGGRAESGSQFYNSGIVYYERNPYFETCGEEINNAKIKYFRYKVTESDQVINAITLGNIDIGEPNATPENADQLTKAGIAHVEVDTAGYGYVGINPRFVPDITVRRAIMKAMDRSLIKNNYYYDFCEIINRPISTTSWANPKGATVYSTKWIDDNGVEQTVTYDYTNDDAIGNEIEQMIKDAGYVKNSKGIYQKRLADNSIHELSYKFTIAGQNTDHPAYAMFIKAQNLLNEHGFDIKVVTSLSALSDLSAGKLAVWAAAWSSTIDPDMYQVYHKDSNASAVNNWGYPQIRANGTLYSYEQQIIDDLSRKIEQGRETDNQDARVRIYAQALDLVMELAVELPTYQRKDMTAYRGDILDRATMTAKPNPYEGLVSRIWELDYLKVEK